MIKELGRRDESDERWCGEESWEINSKCKRGVAQLGMKNTSLTSLLVTQLVSNTQKQERAHTPQRMGVQLSEMKKLKD